MQRRPLKKLLIDWLAGRRRGSRTLRRGHHFHAEVANFAQAQACQWRKRFRHLTKHILDRAQTITAGKLLQEIAQELNVDTLLEGAVGRSGDRVGITIRLAQVSPEQQLWAQEYDRSIRDVLSLQDEIARTVIDEIRTKLTPDERTRLSSAPPVNPEAHDDYLRGRYLLGLAVTHNSKLDKRQYTELDIQAAIGHFKHAIEDDTTYASAYAGLADAYILLGHPVWGGQLG